MRALLLLAAAWALPVPALAQSRAAPLLRYIKDGAIREVLAIGTRLPYGISVGWEN